MALAATSSDAKQRSELLLYQAVLKKEIYILNINMIKFMISTLMSCIFHLRSKFDQVKLSDYIPK